MAENISDEVPTQKRVHNFQGPMLTVKFPYAGVRESMPSPEKARFFTSR